MAATMFSLKDLCRYSARQLKMFMVHPEAKPKPNANWFTGEKFQDTVANELGDKVFGQEMGYFYRFGLNGDNLIFYSSDIVTTSGDLIEVKSVSPDRPVEDWYLNNSVLQCAAYCSFIKHNPKIKTAKFYVNQGHEAKEMVLPSEFKYFLQFGSDKYEVCVTEPEKIVDFYVRKAAAACDWNQARLWDDDYKKKEFETLKPYFSYEKVA